MKFFTVAVVLTLAVAANASIHALGWGAGSTAVHASNPWVAGPYAAAWAPAAAHWAAGPAVISSWAAPHAAHWGNDDGQWRGDAPGQDGQWHGDATHWAAPTVLAAHASPVVVAAHAAPVVVAAHHAAPIAHSATYVAANRGSEHVAPLPGHIQSVKSLNVAPAPGTNW